MNLKSRLRKLETAVIKHYSTGQPTREQLSGRARKTLPLAVRLILNSAIRKEMERGGLRGAPGEIVSLDVLDLSADLREQLRDAFASGEWQGEKDPEGGDWSDEQYLQAFAAWGRLGCFAREPDFPAALENYRKAISQAKAELSKPLLSGSPDYSADMRRGWWWLMGMLGRLRTGILPVTEVEYRELVLWFLDNGNRLTELFKPSGLLDLGNGQWLSVANLEWNVQKGPRAYHAGEAAENLRRLREIMAHREGL